MIVAVASERPLLSIEVDAGATSDEYTTVPFDTGMAPGAST